MIRRPAILARFPRLSRLPPAEKEWADDWPLVRLEQLAEYPALSGDLMVWIDQVEPRYRLLDHRARALQNEFLRGNVLLIIGGLAATGAGASLAALGGRVVWLAIVQAILTGVLGGLAIVMRSLRDKAGFLTARLKAELLKSEFFLFLSRTDEYAKGNASVRFLQRVEDIETMQGGT